VRADPTPALTEIATATAEGPLEELIVGGQSAALVADLMPAADLAQMLASDAETALADAVSLVS
jgi:hypothetical protein